MRENTPSDRSAAFHYCLRTVYDVIGLLFDAECRIPTRAGEFLFMHKTVLEDMDVWIAGPAVLGKVPITGRNYSREIIGKPLVLEIRTMGIFDQSENLGEIRNHLESEAEILAGTFNLMERGLLGRCRGSSLARKESGESWAMCDFTTVSVPSPQLDKSKFHCRLTNLLTSSSHLDAKTKSVVEFGMRWLLRGEREIRVPDSFLSLWIALEIIAKHESLRKEKTFGSVKRLLLVATREHCEFTEKQIDALTRVLYKSRNRIVHDGSIQIPLLNSQSALIAATVRLYLLKLTAIDRNMIPPKDSLVQIVGAILSRCN